jgi:Uma2 family endonuclease
MSTIATFTVDEFEHMIGCGAFTGPNEKRVELIRGELREMSPTGVDHEELVDWLNEWSFDTVDRKAVQVRVQETLGIPELETIPLPDLAWVRRQRVRRRRPRPSDVLLLTEVADSSVAYDTGEKLRLYSEAGVRDYWVADIPHRISLAPKARPRRAMQPAAGRGSSARCWPDVCLSRRNRIGRIMGRNRNLTFLHAQYEAEGAPCSRLN